MIKVKFDKLSINEIQQSELVNIEDIISGNQFEELFGGKQRILIPITEKFRDYKDVSYGLESSTNLISNEYMKVFEGLLKDCSTEKTQYSIDYSSGNLKKVYKHKIPQTGEEITKTRTVSMGKISEIIAGAFNGNLDRFSDLKKIFDDVSASMTPVISDAKNFALYFNAFALQNVPRSISPDDPDLKGLSFEQIFVLTLNRIAESGGQKVVLISRAPVDLIRMSDFPAITKSKGADYEKGIVSCHSPPRFKKVINPDTNQEELVQIGGEYFDCAVQESKNNGAVAFMLSQKSIEGHEDKLQERDFFKDVERDIKGPYPVQRIRLRRYLNIKYQEELLVPEINIYPLGGSILFKQAVDKWCNTSQSRVLSKLKSDMEADLDDYVLIGGSYSDSTSTELLQSFLGIQLREPGFNIKPDKKISELIYDPSEFKQSIFDLAGISDIHSLGLMNQADLLRLILTRKKEKFQVDVTFNQLLVEAPDINQLGNSSFFDNFIKEKIEEHIGTNLFDFITVKSSVEDKYTVEAKMHIRYTLDKSNEDIKKTLGIAKLIQWIFKSNSTLCIGRHIIESPFYKHMKKEAEKELKKKFGGRPPGVSVKKKVTEKKKLLVNFKRG